MPDMVTAAGRRTSGPRVPRGPDATSWPARIRRALDEDRVVLHAEPIVALGDGRTVRHELLVRLIDVDGTLLAPGAFVPTAERCGLIGAIDRRVLELAVPHARRGHPVAINLSAATLSDPRSFGVVERLLRSSGTDPGLIDFEITETAVIEDEAVARSFVARARELGCRVALDDFGTGYGCFSHLKHLPVHVLKIDREFVSGPAPGSGVDALVIRAIVALARGLGLETVAEGVESTDDLRLVRALGVDCAQGFLFDRSAPADAVLGPRRPSSTPGPPVARPGTPASTGRGAIGRNG